MTQPKRLKNARDQWNDLVDFAASADVDAIADMSEAEVDAELAKAGFDVDEENRVGQAEHDAAVRARAPRARPLLTRRQRASAWLAAPAAALVASGSMMLVGETVTLVATGPDAGAQSLEAAALRSEAANALEAGQWARCLALLDEARSKDPKGDDAPGVRDVRRIAMGKLGMVDGSRP